MSGPMPPASAEPGYTLVEVMVTTLIMAIVLAILYPIVSNTLTTFGRQSDRSGAVDHANLGLQQIEHDVLASSTLIVPGVAAGTAGNDLQMISILPVSSQPAQTASCVEYKVPTQTAPQPLTLQRRSRVAGTGITWGAWQILLGALKLNGQAAGAVIPNPAGATPFTSPVSNGKSVAVDLQVQNGTSPVIELKTTATGRTVLAGFSGAAAWTAQCS
jgi:prepilin-type N-terminal cleavage/methylation domain-containing protein